MRPDRLLPTLALALLAGCTPGPDAVYREHAAVLRPMQTRLAAAAKALPDPPRTAPPAPALAPRPEASETAWTAAFVHAASAADPSVWEHTLPGPALYLSGSMGLESVLRHAVDDGASLAYNDDAAEALRIQAAAGLVYAFVYRYLDRPAGAPKDDHTGTVGIWAVDLRTGAVVDAFRVPVGSGYTQAQVGVREAVEGRYATKLTMGPPPGIDALGESARAQEQMLIWGGILLMLVGPLVALKLANVHMVNQVRAFAAARGLEVEENRWWGLAHHPSAQGTIGGRKVAYRSYSTGSKGKGAVGLVEVAAALPAGRTFTMSRVLRVFEGSAIRDALAAPTVTDDAFRSFFTGAEPVLPLLDDAARRILVEHGDGELVAAQAGLAFKVGQTMMTSAGNRARFERLLDALLALAPRLEAGR